MVMTERFPAIVTRLADDRFPRGRVHVKCPEITGDADQELPEPLEPVWQWGWFTVPDIGEEIEIEAVVADDTAEDVPGQAFLEAPEWRWTGRRFQSGEGEQPRPPNTVFTATNHGKRRGFATPTGHFLMFDDTVGAERVILSWTDSTNVSSIEIDPSGIINITTPANGTVNINAAGGTINILGGTVNIGDGADSPIARFNELKQWADAHVHPTSFGPSGPPSTPLPPATGSGTGNVAP